MQSMALKAVEAPSAAQPGHHTQSAALHAAQAPSTKAGSSVQHLAFEAAQALVQTQTLPCRPQPPLPMALVSSKRSAMGDVSSNGSNGCTNLIGMNGCRARDIARVCGDVVADGVGPAGATWGTWRWARGVQCRPAQTP